MLVIEYISTPKVFKGSLVPSCNNVFIPAVSLFSLVSLSRPKSFLVYSHTAIEMIESLTCDDFGDKSHRVVGRDSFILTTINNKIYIRINILSMINWYYSYIQLFMSQLFECFSCLF